MPEALSWLAKCRCIVSKHYSAALPALDQEFDDVDPKTTGMTARHFLLFCYYGGLIYTGDRHPQLTACICMPDRGGCSVLHASMYA